MNYLLNYYFYNYIKKFTLQSNINFIFQVFFYFDTILHSICLQMEFKDKETKWEW